jgi:hypothetical protein
VVVVSRVVYRPVVRSCRMRKIVLPERGVLPALRVPERVKDWLAAGLELEVVRVRAVDWRVPTAKRMAA